MLEIIEKDHHCELKLLHDYSYWKTTLKPYIEELISGMYKSWSEKSFYGYMSLIEKSISKILHLKPSKFKVSNYI